MRVQRKIIRIDEQKCNGCGLCVPSCAEGALQIVDGKARLVKESYCDGLGACLGECPQDAIIMEEREADAFDEAAVTARQATAGPSPTPAEEDRLPCGCPGSLAQTFEPASQAAESPAEAQPAELRQWPIQLHLVSPDAPYWDNADLLVLADCVAVAYGGLQSELVRGRRLVLACPKLDDTSPYVDKLAAILSRHSVRSLLVAHMDVPCCTGIVRMAQQALEQSGASVPLTTVKVGLRGEVIERD